MANDFFPMPAPPPPRMGGSATVRQSYPWTNVQETGGAGAQLAGLGGIDFNALLQLMRKKKEKPPKAPLPLRSLNQERYLQSMRDSAEIAKLKAEMGGSPLKWYAPPGGTAGLIPDELAMNAYQRQLFLPQAATAAPGGPGGSFLRGEVDQGSNNWWAGNPQGAQMAAQNWLASIPNPNVPPPPPKEEEKGK